MTSPVSDRINDPVPVEIKNWPDPPAKLPTVKNTIVRSILLSNAGFDGMSMQLGDYEPKRIRMVIIPLDAAVSIQDSNPTNVGQTSDVTHKADGGIFPNGIQPYEFYGPDALWVVRLSADTRVTIVKEYC